MLTRWFKTFGFVVMVLAWCVSPSQPVWSDDPVKDEAGKAEKDDRKWTSMIVPGSLDGWKATNFGGEGKVECDKEGVIHFEPGNPLTGITYGKEFPKDNFEIRWEARRVDGSDFLAGLTFPIGDSFCSFIAGGWGGGVTGISSINGNDASENETTQFLDYKKGQWYKFHLRLTPTHIIVTIDGKELVKVQRGDKRFSIRNEVRESRPLGYCVFETRVEMRGLEYRTLDDK
jgi:Domain of Unknown Function (DUF1080)